MALAGMIGQPYGGSERAGDFSPMKYRSNNNTNYGLEICLCDKIIFHFWFIFIRWY